MKIADWQRFDWPAFEAQLGALFAPGCDPYHAAASLVFDAPKDAVTQDQRDVVKRVFTRVAAHLREAERADNARCTGSLVHDEFTACPVHDRSRG